MTRSQAVGLGLVVLASCGDDQAGCEEDVRAQVIDERVTLEVGDESLEAELADDAVERERGWMHRRCDREALLLVPDVRGELPVWGCGLVDAVDLHFIRAGEVVEVVRDLLPCGPACGACPLVGEGIEVDAVLETPASELAAEQGAVVRGWP